MELTDLLSVNSAENLRSSLVQVERGGEEIFVLMVLGDEGLLGEELFLVAALHDVGEDEDGDHEVEGGLGHGHNLIAADVKVGEVAAFGDEHDAHDEENEEAEDFIHAIFLQEVGDFISEPNHENTTEDDGDDDELDAAVVAVFGQGHGGEDRIEGENDVHGDDEGDGLAYGSRFLIAVAEVVGSQHVKNLFDRSVENEGSAKEDDDGVEGEATVKVTFDGAAGAFAMDVIWLHLGAKGPVEKGVFEFGDESDDHKKEADAESYREADAETADEGLLLRSDSFGLQRDVEQVVETEDSL